MARTIAVVEEYPCPVTVVVVSAVTKDTLRFERNTILKVTGTPHIGHAPIVAVLYGS